MAKGVSRRKGACGAYHPKFERTEHAGGAWEKLNCVAQAGGKSAKLDTRRRRRKVKLQLSAEARAAAEKEKG